jgi:23S rRNA U2552 (ribose-2'-O)-methylase RlmE/FtsJ
MAMTITVTLNDVDEKCMRYLAASPEAWVQNFVAARVFAAKQEIYQTEIRRMTADPAITSIPADIDTVVAQAELRYASDQPEIPSMTPPQG